MRLGSVLIVHAAGLEEVSVLVPDHDVAGLDAGLLQPLGNGHDQRGVGRDSFAAKAVHFEADHFVRREHAGTMLFHASTGLSRPV